MEFIEQIKADLKQAMLQKDELKKSALRDLKGAFDNQAALLGRPLNQDETVQLVLKKVTEAEEALDAARQASRGDLVSENEARLQIFCSYAPAIPKLLDEVEIEKVVRQIVNELSAQSGAPGLGDVLKACMPRLQGKADGKLVTQVIRSILQK
jgi:uncharacterized protein YqeY